MVARRPYATDLSDDEWRILEPLIPKAKPGGRPRAHETRELLEKRCASERVETKHPVRRSSTASL
jgi:transposase